MKFQAVSTFNADGLDKYGRRMMQTFLEFWPKDVPLKVYFEDWGLTPDSPRIELLDLNGCSSWLLSFKTRHADRPVSNYRMDAVRFSHKVAALLHTIRNSDADVIIWVDGDVFTHSPITLSDLEELAPDSDEWISWLDRTHMYPECGFYMINTHHPKHNEIVDSLESMYEKDLLFDLKEFHDSYVLQQVVLKAKVHTKSISSAEGRKTMHPLINGPLGKWFDHLKGDRKGLKRSHNQDLMVQRTEAHWQ